MRKVNIIVMGKTGAGKSTIVNALLSEDVAETGVGKAVTLENKKYSKRISDKNGKKIDLSVYDTVGLEIEDAITKKTIEKIKEHIDNVEENSKNDEITAVWFCVNWRCNRFEKYEINLIRSLSVEKCIPFIIVITQSLDDTPGNLEKSINDVLPDMLVSRILAKDYQTRVGSFKAYGLPDLLMTTISEYPRIKIKITEEKLKKLVKKENDRKQKLRKLGNECVSKYTNKAAKAGFPIFAIPHTQRICSKMIDELNEIFDLSIEGEKTSNFILSLIFSPLMIVPGLSHITSESIVSTAGDSYLNALMKLVDEHANYDIENMEEVVSFLKESLKNNVK